MSCHYPSEFKKSPIFLRIILSFLATIGTIYYLANKILRLFMNFTPLSPTQYIIQYIIYCRAH